MNGSPARASQSSAIRTIPIKWSARTATNTLINAGNSKQQKPTPSRKRFYGGKRKGGKSMKEFIKELNEYFKLMINVATVFTLFLKLFKKSDEMKKHRQ